MKSLSVKPICCAFLAFFLTIAQPAWVFCQQSPEEVVMEQIRRHVTQNMLLPAENMRIEFLSRIPSMEKMSGKKITYSIESRPNEQFIGDTSFGVRIFSDNIFVREMTVRVRIEVLRNQIISASAISRGSILTDGDVTVSQKWVRSIPINAVSSLDEVLGKTIIMGVGPNTTITKTMLKEATPVKKGKMVQVILDNGVMKMLTSGMAEEDGAEDTIVKVRNLHSNKVIFARVIGQGKVQVDF
jgi:flagella basal body P-ring formation protein FlgA